jgi:hypothetical protein
MRTISRRQLADAILLLASVLMVGGATWAAWQNSGNAGWFVVLIGGGLGIAAGLLKRNAQPCSEGSAETERT